MKHLTLIPIALFMIGCGHATTQMDRELALKLVERPQVEVMHPAPTIVNVNVNHGQPQRQPAEQTEVAGPWTKYQSQDAEEIADTRTNCMDSPVYNMQGKLVSHKRHCFGSR